MKREERIAAERERLKEALHGMGDAEEAIALPLIEQLAFMRITLDDMQDTVTQKGIDNPTLLRAYSDLVTKYNTVSKRIERFIPNSYIDGIEDFIEID